MGKQKVARLAHLPMDYQRLGLKKEVALWEDRLEAASQILLCGKNCV